MLKKLIFLIFAVIKCFSTKLYFSSDTHSFKLMQITDLHFNLIDSFIVNHFTISNLIDFEKPGLAVVTGDAISLPCLFNPKMPLFISKLCWNYVNRQFRTKKTHYCVALGNHDCEASPPKSRQDFIDYETTLPYSMTLKNPPNVQPGTTYYVPIYSSFNSSQIALVLWMFDSGDHGCEEVKDGRGCVTTDQVKWFLEKDNELRSQYGDQQISMAFCHIPPPEFQMMQNNEKIYGNRDNGVSCPHKNTGFVDALISRKVKALFVGHNHDNDFGGFYKGIELAYGRKTGYNFVDPSKRPNGARTIVVKENEDTKEITYKHYIVEKDGKIIENGEATYRADKVGAC